MKFLILMTNPGGAFEALPESEQQRVMADHDAFTQALEDQGKYVGSYRMAPACDGRTVSRDDFGAVSVRAGAYCDKSDDLGGLYIIEADSLDEAVEWGRRGRFMVGANEVRPLWE